VPITALAGTVRDPSLSPEGTHVVFRWNGPQQDNSDIYVQQLGVTSPPLRLTTDPAFDFAPRWSPDGRSIAFLRGGFGGGVSQVRVVPPLGGAERQVADINIAMELYRGMSLAWCPDSTCVVASDSVGGARMPMIVSIAIDTGQKRQLTFPGPTETMDLDPVISPDGRWLAFRRDTTPFTGDYYRLPIKGRETERIDPVRLTVSKSAGDGPGRAAWTPDSRALIFGARGALWRADAITPGERTRLAFVGQDGSQPSIAETRNGGARLVYARSIVDSNIWRLTTPGAGAPATSPPEALLRSPRSEVGPSLAPDGSRVLFLSNRSEFAEFWTADVNGGNLLQLTSLGALPGFGRWSPDGSQIAFHSDPQGRPDVLVAPANGGPPRVITAKFDGGAFPSFSRDGRWIYYANNVDQRIWKIAASGGEPIRVTNHAATVAIESVDGRDLYYVDNGTRLAGLWKLPLSGAEPQKIAEGVANSAFDVIADGIYYVDRSAGSARVMYYDFSTRRTTVIADNLGAVTAGLTVSADGRLLLFSRNDSSADELMLVENFR
jgi:Tol biopolymer transport system component